MVGEGGFEPPKSVTTDLQSAPFARSGTLPLLIFIYQSWWTDSNPRPADYKSAALPTELYQQGMVFSTGDDYHSKPHSICQHYFSSGGSFSNESGRTWQGVPEERGRLPPARRGGPAADAHRGARRDRDAPAAPALQSPHRDGARDERDRNISDALLREER